MVPEVAKMTPPALMKRWMVVTPEFERWHYNGIDPPEWGADVVEVQCEKRDAKVFAVRLLREQYPDGWIADAECPFTGLTVFPVCDECVEETPHYHGTEEFYGESDRHLTTVSLDAHPTRLNHGPT